MSAVDLRQMSKFIEDAWQRDMRILGITDKSKDMHLVFQRVYRLGVIAGMDLTQEIIVPGGTDHAAKKSVVEAGGGNR
jgi:hypothetical protein